MTDNQGHPAPHTQPPHHLTTQPPNRPAWEGAWRYAQALVAPIVIWAALAVWLGWSNAEDRYDLAAIQEWLEEARNPSTTLRGLVEQYAEAAEHAHASQIALQQHP